MRKYISIGVLILLAALLIRSEFLFETKLQTGAFLGGVLDIDFRERDELRDRIAELESENEELRQELLTQNLNEVDNIKVYSSYPFNSRGEIAIAAGENMGIEEGNTVVYAGNILVGRVRSVFDTTSVVTTVFDPSWEMAVRIGSGEVDALMQGGNELKLSLIPQNDFIESGDNVISADRSLPYGLEVGIVGTVENAEGDVFHEATLESPLNLKELRDVSIYR